MVLYASENTYVLQIDTLADRLNSIIPSRCVAGGKIFEIYGKSPYREICCHSSHDRNL